LLCCAAHTTRRLSGTGLSGSLDRRVAPAVEEGWGGGDTRCREWLPACCLEHLTHLCATIVTRMPDQPHSKLVYLYKHALNKAQLATGTRCPTPGGTGFARINTWCAEKLAFIARKRRPADTSVTTVPRVVPRASRRYNNNAPDLSCARRCSMRLTVALLRSSPSSASSAAPAASSASPREGPLLHPRADTHVATVALAGVPSRRAARGARGAHIQRAAFASRRTSPRARAIAPRWSPCRPLPGFSPPAHPRRRPALPPSSLPRPSLSALVRSRDMSLSVMSTS